MAHLWQILATVNFFCRRTGEAEFAPPVCFVLEEAIAANFRVTWFREQRECTRLVALDQVLVDASRWGSPLWGLRITFYEEYALQVTTLRLPVREIFEWGFSVLSTPSIIYWASTSLKHYQLCLLLSRSWRVCELLRLQVHVSLCTVLNV